MTDTAEFIDGFLEHDRDAARIREYNRQYYLRTRKLKGRQTGDSKTSKSSVPKGQSPSEERRQLAAEKIRRAREAAKKLPPEKRNAVEKKLDKLEKKLKKFKNPFRTEKKVKSVVLDQPKITGPSKESMQKVKDAEKKIKDLEKRLASARKEAKKKDPSARNLINNKINKIERDLDRKRDSVVKVLTRNPLAVPGKKLGIKKAKPRDVRDIKLENPFKGFKITKAK